MRCVALDTVCVVFSIIPLSQFLSKLALVMSNKKGRRSRRLERQIPRRGNEKNKKVSISDGYRSMTCQVPNHFVHLDDTRV